MSNEEISIMAYELKKGFEGGDNLYTSAPFYYLSGRCPDITINMAVVIVNLARDMEYFQKTSNGKCEN